MKIRFKPRSKEAVAKSTRAAQKLNKVEEAKAESKKEAQEIIRAEAARQAKEKIIVAEATNPVFLSEQDLADRWNLDKHTIRIWRYHRKDFPEPIFFGRRTIRFHRSAIIKFEKHLAKESTGRKALNELWSEGPIEGRCAERKPNKTKRQKMAALKKEALKKPSKDTEKSKKALKDAFRLLEKFKSNKR